MTTVLPTKMQTWGDDLRLPSITLPSQLMAELEPLRRISAPFQSKHLAALKRNTWFALRRPSDRSRTGLLVIWPEHKACIYVQGGGGSNGNPRAALLRLRVDSQFVSPAAGLTVFAATLSPAARRLWIEDVIQWKGAAVQEQKTFTQRWSLVQQWINHHYTPDPRMVAGIEVAPATWTALTSVRPDGVWDFQQDEAGRKRLFWLGTKAPVISTVTSAVTSSVPAPVASTPSSPSSTHVVVPVAAQSKGPLIAIATKESGPDQWALTAADGTQLGRALIRRFQISSEMRSVEGKPRVEVQWSADFGKWEIVGLSTSPASPKAKFVVPK
jgi:hypothetical protein